MFQIQIADTDITGGSIPITWCLEPGFVEEVTKIYGKDPQVVIIVAPTENYHENKQVCHVAPLRELLTYVPFKSKGTNKIWAFITSGPSKQAKNEYMDHPRLLNFSGDDWAQYTFEYKGDYLKAPRHNSTLEVEIPEGAFAKEPPQWEKDWVNHLFNRKVFDQCQFRRRRLFAYTIQPVLMLLQIVSRLMITVLSLLIGAKNFSLQPLLHPMTYDWSDQLDTLRGGSIFIRSVKEPAEGASITTVLWYFARTLCLLPFMPLILGFVVLSLLFSPVLLAIAAGAVAVIFVVFLTMGLTFFIQDRQNHYELNEEDLELLTCNPERRPLSMKNLPSKKKTIKLKFLDLKNKVCRPFSV